jgi:hypothetical protein
MTDDASDGSTRDSGKDSYNSSWTSRLVDFQVEIDVPKEVLHSFQPYPNPRVPAQSHPTKVSFAQVASRVAPASTASPHVTPPPIPSPLDLTTVQTPAFVLHLQQEMANMEARIAAKIEARQTELHATAQTPTVQQESTSPPPAPDPQSDQLESILSFLTQQMSNMESRLTASLAPSSKHNANKLRNSHTNSEMASLHILSSHHNESVQKRTSRPQLLHRLAVRTALPISKTTWTRPQNDRVQRTRPPTAGYQP